MREAKRRRLVTGGRRGQWERLGRIRLQHDRALLHAAEVKRQEVEAKRARLAALRVRGWRALLPMSLADLRDQVRVFKEVDGVDIKLGDAASKLACLLLLTGLLSKPLPPFSTRLYLDLLPHTSSL